MIDSRKLIPNNIQMTKAKHSLLDKYIKDESVDEPVRTSIVISKEQKQFIEKNNIVLSELVRDVLNDLIERTKSKSK